MNILTLAIWSIVLGWNAPTFNADNTPLNDLAGFNVYEGATSNTVTTLLTTMTNGVSQVPSYGDAYQYQFEPSSNDLWFAVSAIDMSGNESVLSPAVHWLDGPPGAPTARIMITIQQ